MSGSLPTRSGLTPEQIGALTKFRAAFNVAPDVEFIQVSGELLDSDLQPAQLVEVRRGPFPFVELILAKAASS